jgi:hypothetical protein
VAQFVQHGNAGRAVLSLGESHMESGKSKQRAIGILVLLGAILALMAAWNTNEESN